MGAVSLQGYILALGVWLYADPLEPMTLVYENMVKQRQER